MIEPRLYRAAFVPALLAVLLFLFAFKQQPAGVPQPAAGDVLFDGDAATLQAREFARLAPDRRAGTPGDAAMAGLVKRALLARRFGVQVDRFRDERGTRLTNVIGRRPGASARQIVIIAERDAHAVPDVGGSAADTAALLELARVLQGRAPRKTVLLVSADGSAHGDAGVRRWIDTTAEPGLIDAVVVVDQLGASRSKGPLVIGWSNDHRRANIGLERSARAAVRVELGSRQKGDSFLRQLPRVALPIGLGAQSVLIERGFPAVRLSGSGELDPTDHGERLNANRYAKLGRAVMRLYAAVGDAGRPEQGPASYLTFGTKMIPGWAVSLLALSLLLPPLVASVDALARARRQHEHVARWFGWLGAGFAALIVGLLVAEGTVLVGLVHDPPPAPLQPASVMPGTSGGIALALTLLAALGTWLAGRRWTAARLGLMERPAAGAGVAIALSVAALGVGAWLLNPLAALVLAPAVHATMLAALTSVRRTTGFGLILGGALPLALVLLYYALHFDLAPLQGAWYAFLLVTGHQTGLLATLLGCALVAVLVSAIVLVAVRPDAGGGPRRRGEPSLPGVFGPRGHAGRGALGSTGPAVRG